MADRERGGRDDAAALDGERALVARAQAGDRDAVGELLHRYGPTLYRSVLLPRLGSAAAAKDALSETYAKVVERIDRFTWAGVGFYPWLRTVALRVALDLLRARKRMLVWEAEDVERELDAAATTTPIDSALAEKRDRDATRRKVDAALERIHPRYATAIRLRILDEMAREDVARALEVTPATFDVLLHRAIAALRKAVGTMERRNSDHDSDSRDPESPPSAEELAAAGALRDALEAPTTNVVRRASDGAEFAQAVALAHAPRSLDESEHRAIVERAIARREPSAIRAPKYRARAALWIGGGLALAAALALVLTRPPVGGERSETARASTEPRVPVRSTQALFREPFPRSGGESARIDRIASARASDLRDNRFAAWGVR